MLSLARVSVPRAGNAHVALGYPSTRGEKKSAKRGRLDFYSAVKVKRNTAAAFVEDPESLK